MARCIVLVTASILSCFASSIRPRATTSGWKAKFRWMRIWRWTRSLCGRVFVAACSLSLEAPRLVLIGLAQIRCARAPLRFLYAAVEAPVVDLRCALGRARRGARAPRCLLLPGPLQAAFRPHLRLGLRSLWPRRLMCAWRMATLPGAQLAHLMIARHRRLAHFGGLRAAQHCGPLRSCGGHYGA